MAELNVDNLARQLEAKDTYESAVSEWENLDNKLPRARMKSRTVPVTDSETEHLRALKTIYKNLTTVNPPARYGSHWEDLGFQGNDPATDFRGMGTFGLLQLVHYSQCAPFVDQLQRIFMFSRDSELQNFPFAAISVNISRSVLQALRSGGLDCCAGIPESGSFLNIVNNLYIGLFVRFFDIWTTRRCTIAETSMALKNVEKYGKKSPGRAIQEAHILMRNVPKFIGSRSVSRVSALSRNQSRRQSMKSKVSGEKEFDYID